MLHGTDNRRILVIDDTESIHNDIRKTLAALTKGDVQAIEQAEAELFGDGQKDDDSQINFTVDSALQGQEGHEKVKQARSRGKPYAMAFVDMRMPPGWDGLETIEKVWEEDPNLQIVICTAFSDYTLDQITERLGVTDRLLFLKKPFDVVEVTQLAMALTEKWQLLQQTNIQLEELEKIVEARTHDLRQIALHDKLTGMANRSYLIDRLKESIAAGKEGRFHFALLYMDFDRFKVVNDSLGHQAGDLLLIELGKRLSSTLLRNKDRVLSKEDVFCSRLGGDEFVMLIDGIRDITEAAGYTEQLLAELRKPYNLRGHEVCSTASIGITTSFIDYGQPEDVLRDADTAMYRAKDLGKDRYVVFDQLMHQQACLRIQLETDLRKAIDRKELFIEYQPIVAVETGGIIGAEALLRWKHPSMGQISPIDFIPIAEETGEILAIGAWVIRWASRKIAEWQKRHPGSSGLHMSVNVSKRQLLDPGFYDLLAGTLSETKISPASLKLEITESVVMESPELVTPVLKKIKQLGVGLSMDDFGIGQSSLTCLNQFPIDTLKIDKAFISNLSLSRQHAGIVQAVITLASNMGVNVVAEGIESLEQLVQIQSLECSSAQGYFFSPPVSAEFFGGLLAAGKPLGQGHIMK